MVQGLDLGPGALGQVLSLSCSSKIDSSGDMSGHASLHEPGKQNFVWRKIRKEKERKKIKNKKKRRNV